jgi:cobaltochelatase CobN
MQYQYWYAAIQGRVMTPSPLATRRHAFAQFLVCASGCCCGRTDKGKPAVPVPWLKAEWRARRLNPRVQLTIAECLGPCDLVNVVAVFSEAGPIWLGGLTTDDSFQVLLDWATASREAGSLLALPLALQAHRFERFTSPFLTPESAP